MKHQANKTGFWQALYVKLAQIALVASGDSVDWSYYTDALYTVCAPLFFSNKNWLFHVFLFEKSVQGYQK